MLVRTGTLVLISARGLRFAVLCSRWLLGVHSSCKQHQRHRGHQTNYQLLRVHPPPFCALAIGTKTRQGSLHVLKLLGNYFRPYFSAFEEAVTSAATVRQRPQSGVKPGSSFVQDGLFLVLVVATIW